MIVYSVYEPPGSDASRVQRADDLVFVRDAFSRPTIVLGPLWLAFTKQWDSLLAYFLLAAVLALVVLVAEIPLAFWGYFFLGLNAIFALEQPLFRGFLLEARGWKFVGVSEGRTEQDAEHRFVDAWLRQDDGDGVKTKPVVSPKIDLQPVDKDRVSSVLRDARPPRVLN